MRASVTCLALAVVASVNLFADPISGTSYSTSCSADGSSMTVGTQSCSAGISMKGASFAAADANVVASVAANPAQYSDLHARQSIRLNTGQGSTLTAGATSNVSYSENFTTAGPLRSGFMLVQLVNRNLTAGDNSIGEGNFSMSLIPNNFAPQGANVGCGMDVAQMECYSSSDYLRHFSDLGGFSVELGRAFTLGFNGSLSGMAGQFMGNGSSTLDLDYQFRFLESDGATPVQVFSAAPEPGTWQLLLTTSAGIATARKRLAKLSGRSRRNQVSLM